VIYFFLIIIFALVQALLLGRIHILGVATPLLYVYLALLFPRGYSRWLQTLLCFIMGLVVDIFENTPGLATTTMTLVGFIQPLVLELFLKKEDDANLRPAINTMGWMKYSTYAFILITVYCLVFFSLEAFTAAWWQEWIIAVGGSLALTLVIILIIDSARR
jgi:rod shape-determining protein MreD